MVKKTAAALLAAALLIQPALAAPESLSYLFAGGTSIYTRNVDRAEGNLGTVCPDYFEIDGAGNLTLTARADRAFVEAMHARGVRVTPFLSNHWNMSLGRAAISNRAALAAQIADAVESYGFDGVDIDIENINHNDRAGFTDFIRILREELGWNRRLTVCVAANPWGVSVGWQGAYDYAALAEFVDHIFIMAYDESYQGGPAGPVASYGFARKSVEYAVKTAPAEKIVLGIPFYGRYWRSGETGGGAALTVSNIRSLTAQYGATVWYDAENDGARATMHIPVAYDTGALWGGKTLAAGTYDIWYENERSWMKKLSLVKEFGLLGAGSWALGQEPAEIWSEYRVWLHGLPFDDIYRHWAEQYIVKLHELGIVDGVGNRYQPQRAITRAEALKIVGALGGLPTGTGRSGFADIRGHWAEEIIDAAALYGIAKGHDGKFRPDDPITREEFAVLLMRVMNLPATVDAADSGYIDLSAEGNAWSLASIAALRVHGVLSEPDDGRFRPKDRITRAEVAKMGAVAYELPRRLPEPGEARSPAVEPR